MSSESILEAISQRRSQSLTALVRDELERLILSGELRGGERLNEAALASRLGVSRGPVREAVRLLERDGLATSVINQGAFVRQVSIEEASELYDLRAVVVGYACGRLAERITHEEEHELEVLVDAMDEAAENEAPEDYYSLNLTFHDRIMEVSACPRSTLLYRSIVKEAHLFRRRALTSADAMRESNAEHRRIVASLKRRDAEAAREAAERHHISGKRRWLRTMD
ncbi:GntR family transcriptional regulator [Roseitranquillus sediminis]|uniref:GntR family transcriptional regulator n=1 Tax=Roseitranquillus sediminis TaxID=2809051 RepID=UPI001D0CB790|nr:GntR family transcriptional regulator [Roseitranquillus sediminis]MBM9595908.1 FCD domain-containing protein [Roseitranquillus sediminis]